MRTPEVTSPAGTGVDAENPWPGLESFTENDAFFFHGRDQEAEELFRLVKRETLTVLLSRSGLGKTSLLRAGLFRKLRPAELLPFYIRLDHTPAAESPAQQVMSLIARAVLAGECEAPQPLPGQTLWEYFHAKDADFWSDKNALVTPVLVFDQFEEIFTLGRQTEEHIARSHAFLIELADLIENRPPAELRSKLDSDQADAAAFSFGKEVCKIILSLREDYLPDLDSLRPLIRSVMNNRLRIQPMSGEQAYDVVVKAGGELVDKRVATPIVRFVAAAINPSGPTGDGAERLGNLEVDPALLSLFCRKLNDQRIELGQSKITADLMEGSSTEILTRFYDDCMDDLVAEARGHARVFVEDCLLTKAGHRNNQAFDDAVQEPGITANVIDQLVSHRLLRFDERQRGVRRVELAHDVLIGVVVASRDARRLRETEAAERARTERERAEAEAKLAAEYERAEREKEEKERAEALAGQAATARARADKLIAFLIFDLRDKLSSIGQLHLIKEVNDRTIAYFETFESSEETDDTKLAKAVALQSRGNIRKDEGWIGQAVDAHTSSLAIFRELAQGPKDPEYRQYGVATQCAALAYALEVQGNITGARELYQEAYTITEQLLKKENPAAYLPTGLTSYRDLIADVLKTQGKLDEAIELYRVSLKEREGRAAADPKDEAAQIELSNSHLSLGDALTGQGQLAVGLKYFNECLAIRKQFAEKNPSDTTRQHSLSAIYDLIGGSLKASGKIIEALEAFAESDQIFARLTKHDPNNASWASSYSVTRFRLAEVQTVAGLTANASDMFSTVLTFRQGLATLDESNAGAQDGVAEAHIRAGDIAVLYGKLTEAAANYRSALDIRSSLAERDATNADRQSLLADALERLGDLSCAQRNLSESLQHYTRSREIREKVARDDKTNLSRQADLATSIEKIGDAKAGLTERFEAREVYEEALRLRENLSAADPDNAQWEDRLAVTYGKLAQACAALGDLRAAVWHFQKSLGILTRLRELAPGNAEWQVDMADVVCATAPLYPALEKPELGLAPMREILPLREHLAKHDADNVKREAELAWSLHLTAAAIVEVEPQSRGEAIEMWKRAREIMSRLKEKAELTAEQQQWLETIESATSREGVAEDVAPPETAAAPREPLVTTSGDAAVQEIPDQ